MDISRDFFSGTCEFKNYILTSTTELFSETVNESIEFIVYSRNRIDCDFLEEVDASPYVYEFISSESR